MKVRVLRYAISLGAMGLVTAVLVAARTHINETTVALALLLVVLFIAAAYGMRPALAASALGTVCYNFFFLPPHHTFVIDDPRNWAALTAFLLTAVIAGKLSSIAKRKAEEADSARREIESLYTELREAFDRASKAEALRQAEQMKAALLDAVTHDLRTPLTAIKASITLLTEDGGEGASLDAEGRKDLLEVVDEEVDRLNRSIGNLVEIARIEAGNLELRRRWIDLEEALDEALARASRYRRDHPVDVQAAPSLPMIHADGRALVEVLYTLLENASKYSPIGSPIVVRLRAGEDRITIEVEDRGKGIPETLREKVFEKFFRVKESDDRTGGTGMGLAIAKGIVEAHGGVIRIATPRGHSGTLVEISLPIGEGLGARASLPLPGVPVDS